MKSEIDKEFTLKATHFKMYIVKVYLTINYGKTLLGKLDNKLSGLDYGENLCDFGYGEKCIVKHL